MRSETPRSPAPDVSWLACALVAAACSAALESWALALVACGYATAAWLEVRR